MHYLKLFEKRFFGALYTTSFFYSKIEINYLQLNSADNEIQLDFSNE